MKSVSRLSDQKIVRFNAQYDQYYSLIFSIVLAKISDFHDAEDICQEVFILLYRKLDEIESPRRWLLGCLRNVLFEFYRKKRNREIDIESLFDDVSMGYVNGFRDTRIMIAQALDDIYREEGDRDASLFDLVAVYNYSFAQASAHLKISYKQAVYRYGQIAGKVRSKLKEKGISTIEDLL